MAMPLRLPETDVEVAIAGGGPAGTALATRLSALGHAPVLIVDSKPRRYRPVETLAPTAEPLLTHFGLQSALTAGLIGRAGTEARWSTPSFEQTPGHPAYLIDRARFDAALTRCAAVGGVRILAGRVTRIVRTDGRWALDLATPSRLERIVARFAIDAVGRRGLTPRPRRRGPRLVGLHLIWRGTHLPCTARVASGPDYWVWGAPVGAGDYATSVFVDPILALRDGQSLSARAATLVDASGVLPFEAGKPAGPMQASDATPQLDEAPFANGFGVVGDSALAVDPLSSAGVQLALQSAAAAAVSIHTVLQVPGSAALAAEFWRGGLARRYARHTQWAASFYAEGMARFGTPFWSARAEAAQAAPVQLPTRPPLPAPQEPLRLGKAIRIAPEPCVVGDIVTWHPAVAGPGLPEPVAFVDGYDLPSFLSRIMPGTRAQTVAEGWASAVGSAAAMKLLSWAWLRGVVETDDCR